ncbi:hypothetical protein PtB15_15B334 [Puccinia triticina]|nr:hypothetical protein PtB15_15B334 [Puccinia triticina]
MRRPVYCGAELADEASSSDSIPVVTPPSSNTSVWPAPPSLPATIDEPGSSASLPIVIEEATLFNIEVNPALLNSHSNPTPEPACLRAPIEFGPVTDWATEAAPLPVPETQPAPATTVAEMIEFDHFAIRQLLVANQFFVGITSR